jgi:hypothetical protein
MSDAPPPPPGAPPPPPRSRISRDPSVRGWIGIAAVVALGAVVWAIVTAVSNDDDQTVAANVAPTTEATTATTEATTLSTSTTTSVPVECTPATDAQVGLVTGTLRASVQSRLGREAVALEQPYQFRDDNGVLIIAAHIMGSEGERISSADLWLIDDSGTVWSGTSSAEEYSSAPSGKLGDFPPMSMYGNALDRSWLDCFRS